MADEIKTASGGNRGALRIFRVTGGRIAEAWDTASRIRQLGIPSRSGTPA